MIVQPVQELKANNQTLLEASTPSAQHLVLFRQLFTTKTFLLSLYGSDFRILAVLHFVIRKAMLTDLNLSL